MPTLEIESTYTPDDGASSYILEPVTIDLPGTLTVAHVPTEDQDVSFRVELVDYVLRPTAVTVSSRSGQEITSTDLRAVNVKTLWRAAIVRHLGYLRSVPWTQRHTDERLIPFEDSPIQLPDEDLARLRLQGPDRETLDYVADIYSLGLVLGLAPALYVQQTFAGESLEPLPRTTATKWIKKARDLGLIQESTLMSDPILDEDDRDLLRATGFGGADNGDS